MLRCEHAPAACRFVECEPDVLRLCLQADDHLVRGPCAIKLLRGCSLGRGNASVPSTNILPDTQ